ncbi:hypothetical protein GDO86_019520 [Hymenochirus boettgeri]|uniref:Uncharacterized protein n=1 Tax=Hymenochirus boettgeri TaxID=247094 RepID=A0A8T2IJR5_9PIPI|nr:hypothetical protein GDO86_019520 [Hymenochirus boettgeri]
MIAALRNHPTVCSLLLDRGAQINLQDREAKSALILACENSKIQAAETLIHRGANLVQTDNNGFDALYYASQSKDEHLRKLVQAAIDKKKSGKCLFQVYHQNKSKEQELVSTWKKRYEEEHKKGVWLQGDLMRKTQEIERLGEEYNAEKRKMKEMVEKLKDLLDGPTEIDDDTGNIPQTSDIYISLSRAIQQVKAIKEQKHKELQTETLRSFSEKTVEDLNQGRHQEAMRRLQADVVASNEREDIAQRRSTELEGHLENMRAVLSQFETRKRLDSTIVVELQEQITDVTRERDELLKRLQRQEENLNKNRKEDLYSDASNIKVLKEFLNKLKGDCINVQTKTGAMYGRDSSILDKNIESWKKTIMAMERYLEHMETSPSNHSLNGTQNDFEEGHQAAKFKSNHRSMPMVEKNILSLQGEQVSSYENNMIPLSRESNQLSIESHKTIDLLKEKVLDLESEISALRLSNDRLVGQMMHVSQEKQNLEEGLLTLQERLQAEYGKRQDVEKKYMDLKQQHLQLSDELLVEQEKSKKMASRLESLHSEMAMLRDSFPPEIVREGNPKDMEMFSSDVLEELYWNVGTLVRKYNDAEQQKMASQREIQKLQENQAISMPITEHNNVLNEMNSKMETQRKEVEELRQRLFQAMRSVVELNAQLENQAINFISKEEHEHNISAFEKEVTTLKEENEACKVALEGKCEEAIVLKQLLDQEVEEGQEIRTRDSRELQENERIKNSLETHLQTLQEEVNVLSRKHNEALKLVSNFEDLLTSEREKVKGLEVGILQQKQEAKELRITAEKCVEEKINLTQKLEDHLQTSREKDTKVEELVSDLESLTKEIDQQQKKNGLLALQLEESDKRHQDIIRIYRTHLLNAAQVSGQCPRIHSELNV